MKLEETCVACNGTTTIPVAGSEARVECDVCSGIGMIPSHTGNQILAFLDRYFRPAIHAEIVPRTHGET